jgi:hypothetical protein
MKPCINLSHVSVPILTVRSVPWNVLLEGNASSVVRCMGHCDCPTHTTIWKKTSRLYWSFKLCYDVTYSPTHSLTHSHTHSLTHSPAVVPYSFAAIPAHRTLASAKYIGLLNYVMMLWCICICMYIGVIMVWKCVIFCKSFDFLSITFAVTTCLHVYMSIFTLHVHYPIHYITHSKHVAFFKVFNHGDLKL